MHSYPTLQLLPGRERSLLNRHPWVYSGALNQKTFTNLKNGDIVAIANQKNKLLGFGHFNQNASIACRVFHFTQSPTKIDTEFWQKRLQKALQYRQELGCSQPKNTGYRLFNSEGDGLPGLVADVFGDTASLQIKTQGMMNLKTTIVDFLQKLVGLKHIYFKSERNEESGWLLGKNSEVYFEEQGIRFLIDLESGQKTGYFLDQKDNRKLVGALAKGKNILDAFSYSGGFGLLALKNGAEKVTSVDVSEQAIEVCKKTVAQNFKNESRHHTVTANCFEYLREMESNEFDLIILDPPAFAKSTATVDKAARGYKDINLMALRQIKKSGLIFTFSCSHHISRDLFRKIIFGAAKDANRPVRIIYQLNQAPDHPIDVFHPEGEYLKGFVLHVN
jgi:23S rRNA (cytosine1962-C5)-methyltransferase